MKRILIIFIAVMLVLGAFAGCSKDEEIEIENLNGEMITISTDDMTKEQIELLEELSDGEITLMNFMASDLFSRDELAKLGLMPEGKTSDAMGNMNGMGERDTDLSQIDPDTLSFDDVSDEAEAAILDAIESGMTMQQLIEGGEVTMEDIANCGLMPMDGMMPSGEKPSGGRGQQSKQP